MNIVGAIVLAVTPLTAYLLICLLKRPALAFFGVIVVNYFIMGLIRYIPAIQGGVVIDGLLLFTLFLVLLRSRDHLINWIAARNLLTLLSGIWLIYCILLIFNPVTTPSNWFAGVRGLAVYLFLFSLLTAVLLNRYKYLKVFLFLWSVMTLLAVIKALVQKFIGFDAAENHWLFVDGGSSTHIISSGVRYFSFFTDAASFGCGMALSMVVFSITAIYIHTKSLRIYYIIVALLAGYGMMISGTRAAIVIPFVSYAFFIILSKQWKIILPGVLIILCTFVFFKYTYIGHGNTEIRRMRSAFNPTESASFQIRKTNQAEMRVFMKDHPFGIGVGKAKRAEPGDYMYQLPTDTSLVYVWVETGIVGLGLFLLVFLVTFAKGVYDVWYRIRDKQLRGILIALLAGLVGMLVSAYGNEILQQFPNGPIVYMCMAFIFMGRKFDQAITDGKGT
ncbi:MAG: O-antigen ligase family protein [Proteiniphilum sp.]|uniref:O-antigen ligase family protein n=1 Tax=Proteiniphilum sp. TaxID=1926877 RepID=UPI002B1EC2DD|nr:O-antigen ligase family protein [Proteiniphilum sp.]MEA5129464.1 O-antigen ligase family protein [Proteiniphilum sp.]